MNALLDWCESVVGPCQVVSGDLRYHGRTTVSRLGTRSGHCYVKVHRERASWETEVHGYQAWAPAFDGFAPRLIAVREEAPLALVISELPGRMMPDVPLSSAQERAVWHAAGRALADMHELGQGACFGPCRRDGTCAEPFVGDAVSYVCAEIDRWTHRGMREGHLSATELAITEAAQQLAHAFAGEPPIPCHRDYCPVNWLVDPDGHWAGVIDFEFAYWDVRVADFSRYPDWEWMRRPDLVEALLDGYGRSFTPQEEQQLLVSRILYALSAIVWGSEHEMLGFAAEGREAIEVLAGLL